MTKIVVFGAGAFYHNRKNYILPDIRIIAFIDNNYKLHGKELDGVPVIGPDDIHQISYDKILLMSKKENAIEMKRQLLELGICVQKIYDWEQFYDEMYCGSFKFYCGNNVILENRKKVLIISTGLNYNGGSLVIGYAAQVLQNCGYNVMLAAPGGNRKLINEMVQAGINIMICPTLPNLHKEELFWIQQFDIVLVNVFQMISCACEISRMKPVLWWIHEPSELFDDILHRFNEYADIDKMSEINIYAVSEIARRNFNDYFPQRIKKILGFGIPDNSGENIDRSNHKKMIFAVIGNVEPRKAQDILAQAVLLLDRKDKEEAEFWMIGKISENEYGKKIQELALQDSSIQILGEQTRKEIQKKYADIDVVVCPSLEETVSIAIMEGMMYGKVCLASDVIGMADYIENGKNGFICKTKDSIDLSEKIKWIIRNQNKLEEIRRNARKTYEAYFTMDKFADKLKEAIEDTVRDYCVRGN